MRSRAMICANPDEETIRWEIKNTPHHQIERVPPGGKLDDITFDYLVDTGNLFIGSPETVTSASSISTIRPAASAR